MSVWLYTIPASFSAALVWDATAQFIEELVERRFGLTEDKLQKGA